MEDPLDTFDRCFSAVREAYASSLPSFGAKPRALDEALESMTHAGLCRMLDVLARASNVSGGLMASVADHVARRSRPELGQEGLAKQRSFASPQGLIASATGGSMREASKLIGVGEATATRPTFSGERREPKYPSIAAGLAEGRVSLDAADAITGMLDRVAPRADAAMMLTAEQSLAANAPENSLEFVRKLVKAWEARLDPDGVQPREDELRRGRFVSITEDADGSIVLKGRFDPVNGAAIKTAVEAIVSAELRKARDAYGSAQARSVCEHMSIDVDGRPVPAVDAAAAEAPCSCADPDLQETRTIGQLRADALADLARHTLGCTESGVAASTTVVVRTDLDTLMGQLGVASIDGIEQPISAETVRELAASAGIIPVVMSSAGEVLDLGREERLFTRAQKIALAERDGGCAAPGCSRPPQLTEAHHLDWWERDLGRTDLNNGVLLCGFHHHALHRAEWTIRVTDNRVWFIPPVHIDPDRRPRPGNNLRRVLQGPPAPDQSPSPEPERSPSAPPEPSPSPSSAPPLSSAPAQTPSQSELGESPPGHIAA